MSDFPDPSRIERARARTRALKIAAAVGATLLFATTAALARSSHPGATSDSGSDSLDAPERLTDQLEQGLFESGSIGPSSSAPQAQTRTS